VVFVKYVYALFSVVAKN